MFWEGRVSLKKQIESWMRGDSITFAEDLRPPSLAKEPLKDILIEAAPSKDAPGISRLLNEWFEPKGGKTQTAVTPAWIQKTYTENQALWLVAKDLGGTIRGCIACFRIESPYPSTIQGNPWGLIDWFCVHPLWRSKGIGSRLLETIDYLSYMVGRKALVFLKEGLPLPISHLPIYGTVFRTRIVKKSVTKKCIMPKKEQLELVVKPFNAVCRETGLPLVKVEGIRRLKFTQKDIEDWEDAIDALAPCIVFVTLADQIDSKRGWRLDSPVWVYSFRWLAGRYLGSVPSVKIL